MGAISKPIRLSILLHAVLMRAIFQTKLFAQQDLNFRDVNLLRKKNKSYSYMADYRRISINKKIMRKWIRIKWLKVKYVKYTVIFLGLVMIMTLESNKAYKSL